MTVIAHLKSSAGSTDEEGLLLTGGEVETLCIASISEFSNKPKSKKETRHRKGLLLFAWHWDLPSPFIPATSGTIILSGLVLHKPFKSPFS